jgi:4-amino-4-deoxy-L-arabinose transferase-like glycosyltransferase
MMGVTRRLREQWTLVLSFLLSLVTVVVVNPIRQTPMEDDWAYALTVRHYLETGHYQLNEWLAANAVFPTGWGVAFSKVFGYSFATLRVSTLVMALLAMVAVYALAREHSVSPAGAGLASLALLSSPLVLRFAFNFMTDVPYMALLTAAVALYSRGLRVRRGATMAAGSVFAAGAILTRQFGVALVLALALSWLMEPDRRAQLRLYVPGAVLPVAAGLWQVWAASAGSGYGERVNQAALGAYLGSPGEVVEGVLWRPAIIVQYLALFCLPLLVAVGLKGITRAHLAIVGLLLAGTAFAQHLDAIANRMPYLPWNFPVFREHGAPFQVGTALAMVLGGAVLVVVLRSRYSGSLPAHERLLDLVAGCLLVFALLFFKLGDEYLLVFVPLVVVVLVKHLDGRAMAVPVGLSVVALIGAALWTRGQLERETAYYAAGQTALALGAPADEVYTSWEWHAYHNFDLFIAVHGDDDASDFAPYWEWDAAQREQATIVTTDHRPESPLVVLGEFDYTDAMLRTRHVYLVSRTIVGPDSRRGRISAEAPPP